jgi:hypothetical protein
MVICSVVPLVPNLICFLNNTFHETGFLCPLKCDISGKFPRACWEPGYKQSVTNILHKYTECPTSFRTQKCLYNFPTKTFSNLTIIMHVPSFMLNTKQGCANTYASKQRREMRKVQR